MTGQRATSTTRLDAPSEELTHGAGEVLSPFDGVVETHRALAAQFLREGNPGRAFTELARACRSVPMTPRLAASMVHVALRADTIGPAVALLMQGLEESDDQERAGVLRSVVRLLRRAGDAGRALEYLAQLLAEVPTDRRARAVMNALLEREERWEELDASLEKEVLEAQRRGALKTASRAMLRRGRMWSERLHDDGRAALRYGQAAQLAEQAEDRESAFLLRLLHLRSLHASGAPRRAIDEGARLCTEAGERVGKAAQAKRLAAELGLRTRSGERPVVSVETDREVETWVGDPEAPQAGLDPAEAERRHSTQLELVAIAAEAKAQHAPAVAAVLAAAAVEGPDPAAAQKLEAHYVARGAWRELAAFYKDAMERARSPQERATWAEKYAEVLEDELHEPQAAAQAWSEVAQATGDAHAVSEQVRLHAQQKDAGGVRRALDDGVQRASGPAARAQALVLRAELALGRKDAAAARTDFEAALAELPGLPMAAAGLAEVAALDGAVEPILAFERALAALPRTEAGRAELYRRFARLAESTLKDGKRARAAWGQVLAELPADEEAGRRTLVLARAMGDDATVEQVLRAAIAREPRGPDARKKRMELVALLERKDRGDEALKALEEAVRAEPGHQAAWLALAERLMSRDRHSEAAWALEHGASATADPVERMRLWERLARMIREHLDDDERAQGFDARAAKMREELRGALPSGPGGLPLVLPSPRPPRPARKPGPTFEVAAKALEAREEPDGLWELTPPRLPERIKKALGERAAPDPLFDARPSPPVPSQDTGELPQQDGALEVFTGDVEVPSEEFEAEGAFERGPTAEVDRLPLGEGAVPPSFGPSPRLQLGQERKELFERVRNDPLGPDGYKLLAEHFDTASDPDRSSLMLEIARAIEVDPDAAPRAPRLILSAQDRAGLKHPSLRNDDGELLGLLGVALCKLNPAKGKAAGSDEEFRLDAGKGARRTADALLSAVRTLGVRAPDVYFGDDSGPPFSLVYTSEPRLLVTWQAAKKEIADAELRFFAGRALFTQTPELLALRTLRREQLVRSLVVVGQVLKGKTVTAEAKVVRDSVPPRSWDRLKELYQARSSQLDLTRLMDGARHSANRAGLVVCGGVAPAMQVLRSKRALAPEMIELVRFAASERYLQLRSRKLKK